MTEVRIWRNFDPLLVAVACALVFFGATIIHSASYSAEVASFWTPSSPVARHLLFGLIGLSLLMLAARFDYHAFGYWSPLIYLTTLAR